MEQLTFGDDAGLAAPRGQARAVTQPQATGYELERELMARFGPTPHHSPSWSYLDDLPQWRHLKKPRPDIDGQLTLL